MSHNARSRLQFRLPHLSTFAFHPKRTNRGARFLIQSAGKIHNRAAGIAGALPVLSRGSGVSGKEGEIHVGELLSAHTLNKIDLVPRRFELAD